MLEARVLKALCKAIGPGKALPTVYGGFTAITLFGPNAINSFLLPLAMGSWKKWASQLEQTNDPKKRLELQMCQQAALVRAEISQEVSLFVVHDSSFNKLLFHNRNRIHYLACLPMITASLKKNGRNSKKHLGINWSCSLAKRPIML